MRKHAIKGFPVEEPISDYIVVFSHLLYKALFILVAGQSKHWSEASIFRRVLHIPKH